MRGTKKGRATVPVTRLGPSTPKKPLPAAIALALATSAGGSAALAQEGEMPSREEMWRVIQQQQRQIERLETQLEGAEEKVEQTEQKVEAAATAIEEQAAQPALGGAARWAENTHIGGYGEVHFVGDTGLEGAEGGEGGEGGDSEANFKRFVLELGHEFNDDLRLFTELEFENALVIGGEESGEVELEQAWIEYDVTDRHSVAAGLNLVPVGILNETHEPPTFFGVERNLVETRIIPTTWREGMVGASGQLGQGFSYDAWLHTSLNASLEGPNAFLPATSVQSLSNAKAENGAATLRLLWTGMPGVELGVMGQYHADVTQGAADDDIEATLFEVHASIERGPWGFRGMFARWDFFDDAAIANFEGAEGGEGGEGGEGSTLEASGRDVQYGWFVEPSYTFPTGHGDLGFFGRYLQVDTEAGTDEDTSIDEVSFGFNYWPHPDVVVKADYRHQMLENRSDEDSFNLGLGFQF